MAVPQAAPPATQAGSHVPASRGWRSATVACSRVDCLLTTTSKATRAAPNTHGWEVIAIRQTDSPKAEPGQRVGAPAPLGSPLQQRHRPDHRRCRVHERKRIGRDTVCAGEMCSVGPGTRAAPRRSTAAALRGRHEPRAPMRCRLSARRRSPNPWTSGDAQRRRSQCTGEDPHPAGGRDPIRRSDVESSAANRSCHEQGHDVERHMGRGRRDASTDHLRTLA